MLPNRKSAFTLIELSIVLVIIGLVVGGVLVGKDLIHAAEIRSSISQKEQLNLAANSFRLKYDYLPGDMPNSVAAQLGIYALGTHTGGNGDMVIRQLHYSGGNYNIGCLVVYIDPADVVDVEDVVFWRHLFDVGMVSHYTNPADGYNTAISNVLIPSKIGKSLYFRACEPYWLTENYFQMLAVKADKTIPAEFDAVDAYDIDSKLDDGFPNTGAVRILIPGEDPSRNQDFTIPWAAGAAANNCLYGGASELDTAAKYNINSSYSGKCQGIMFRFQ